MRASPPPLFRENDHVRDGRCVKKAKDMVRKWWVMSDANATGFWYALLVMVLVVAMFVVFTVEE